MRSHGSITSRSTFGALMLPTKMALKVRTSFFHRIVLSPYARHLVAFPSCHLPPLTSYNSSTISMFCTSVAFSLFL